MNRSAYDETIAVLSASGLTPRSHRYEDSVFGSWWIEVDANPLLRIIWDGKDGWAVVQCAGKGRRADENAWEDSWIGRKPEEQTPARLVREALALTHR